MVRAAEELLLMVVARPPRQHRADVQRFAPHLPHHVVGSDTLRRVLVVRAASRVHMVVAGVVAEVWDGSIQRRSVTSICAARSGR